MWKEWYIMKEIGEIELFDVTGGRNYTWKEKQAMEEFNALFNERMKKGEISLEERDYIAKQIKYYFRYMNLLDSCLLYTPPSHETA